MGLRNKYRTDKDYYNRTFKRDCEVNGFIEKSLFGKVKLLISPPPIYRYLKMLRKIEMYGNRTNIPFFYRLRRHFIYKQFKKLGLKLSFEIYPFTCGEGLRLLHPGGIIINPKAKIGKNFTIRSFSVIGNRGTGCQEHVPVIGDNVDVGCNCSIIGSIRIGNDVTIGAGSIVISDVPDKAICVGNPARIVKIKD